MDVFLHAIYSNIENVCSNCMCFTDVVVKNVDYRREWRWHHARSPQPAHRRTQDAAATSAARTLYSTICKSEPYNARRMFRGKCHQLMIFYMGFKAICISTYKPDVNCN